jgi:predicted O-methyltransferase YrrM
VNTNKTLEYIAKKYNVDLNAESPIEIRTTSRKLMLETFKELGFKVGVEVGVAEGYFAEDMLKAIPGLKLYGIDIWSSYSGYQEYIDREEKCFEEAKQRTAGYDCTLIRKYSIDAVNQFEDNSLDFVYIDGAHDFYNVATDICLWSKKVKIGGVVWGHDFKRRHHKWIVDVPDVVIPYSYAKRVQPVFVLGEPSNHNDGMFKEGSRSWMFVRQHEDLVNYNWNPHEKTQNFGPQNEVK